METTDKKLDSFKRQVTDNVIQITLDEDRWYYIQDKNIYLPSVTWILDSYPKGIGYKKWLANIGDWEQSQKIFQDAGERGGKVHNAIEALLYNKPLSFWAPMPEHDKFTIGEWQLINYFVDWFKTYKPVTQAIETTVFDIDEKYAGTVDYICLIDEGLLDGKKPTGKLVKCLIDWKTSGAIYETHKIQVAAYQNCLTDIDRIFILRLGSRHKSHYEFFEVTGIESLYKAFLATKDIFIHENGEPEPKFIDIPEILSLVEIAEVQDVEN
jgi:hypothetical protein